MNQELARHLIESLQREFNRTFGKEALGMIKDQLFAESDKAMENGYNYIILNFNPPNLPSAQKLLEIVQMEGRKIRQDEGRKLEEKAREEKRQAANIFDTKPANELAKRSLMIMRALLVDEPNYGMVLEAVKTMAVTYPNIGFSQVHNQFEREWRANGWLNSNASAGTQSDGQAKDFRQRAAGSAD